jgi:hypothetical protein
LIGTLGAAYVYRRTGTNTWDSGTKIVSSSPAVNDDFGTSVSIDGDYAIVGATGDAGGAGEAHIFRRTGLNTWDSGTRVIASDRASSDNFGWSVSISGDYAIVGADREDAGGSSAGAAYIFHRTGVNTWDSGTKIVASDAQADDQFGYSVSISGDYAVVGARFEDGGGGDPLSGAGAAYIFRRTGTNTWNTGTKIVASDATSSDYFGSSVSISGDYAIVGAKNADGLRGQAYVFERVGLNLWSEVLILQNSDSQSADLFGWSVSIDESYMISGAPGEDEGDPGNTNDGAAYIYFCDDAESESSSSEQYSSSSSSSSEQYSSSSSEGYSSSSDSSESVGNFSSSSSSENYSESSSSEAYSESSSESSESEGNVSSSSSSEDYSESSSSSEAHSESSSSSGI